MSLSDKEVCYNNLICFPHKDVKEAIKKEDDAIEDFRNEVLEWIDIDENLEDCASFDLMLTKFKNKRKDKILGKELCSEVEE